MTRWAVEIEHVGEPTRLVTEVLENLGYHLIVEQSTWLLRGEPLEACETPGDVRSKALKIERVFSELSKYHGRMSLELVIGDTVCE